MTEPWNFTEAQRRQFREAHAERARQRLMATIRAEQVAERITSVLAANGFPAAADVPSYLPGFTVSPGVGATVGIAWKDAPEGERIRLLAEYETVLRADGLDVANRGSYLYVAEPSASPPAGEGQQ